MAIQQFDSNVHALPADGTITRSRWYRLRVLQAAPGALVAFPSPRDSLTAYPGAVYGDPRHGYSGLWCPSGAGAKKPRLVLEYSDSPYDELEGTDGANAVDGSGSAYSRPGTAARIVRAPIIVWGTGSVAGYFSRLGMVWRLRRLVVLTAGHATAAGLVKLTGIDLEDNTGSADSNSINWGTLDQRDNATAAAGMPTDSEVWNENVPGAYSAGPFANLMPSAAWTVPATTDLTGSQNGPLVFDFTADGKAPTLVAGQRGAYGFRVNFSAPAGFAGCNAYLEWSEE